MRYCMVLLVIAMLALASFVNIHQGYAQENKDFQKRFEWWPTDANPGPVKDEVRSGRWWWPEKPGQVKPWGNRGYIYVKGGDGSKPLDSNLEEARKAKELERAKKAKELEEAKKVKEEAKKAKAEEAARIKNAKELEEAARIKRVQDLEETKKLKAEEANKAKDLEESRKAKAEEAARIKKAKDLEEANRAKAEEAMRIKKAQELEEAARIKKAQELKEAQLVQKKDKKTEIHDAIVADKDNVLLVSDFSSKTKGEFGTWENDPKDETQFCRMEIDNTLDNLGRPDYFVRLNYDVDSPRPAFNGFWMKLYDLNLTPYEYVSFLVKGENKFTTQLKVEIKNKKGERVVYVISGITDEWRRAVIALDKLKKVNAITDWTDMVEFVVVFDDILATEKAGTICIDDLNFAKFGWEKAERSVR